MYLIQVNLYLSLFYGFYWFFLRKETFYTLNRAYLLGSVILSFGIPFWYSEYLQTFFITQQMNQVFYSSIVLDSVEIQPQTPSDTFTFWDFFKGIYFSGLVFFLSKLIFNFWKLNKVLKADNEAITKNSAFSFFGYIFVDKSIPNRKTILAHEQVHAQQLHSFDVIFFELLSIVCWLNPVSYFYKKTIKNIHEFIADEIASQKEASKADYALLLLSQEFGVPISSQNLTHQFFNQLTLKQRIEMLQKPRSKQTALLKYGFIVPLFILMLMMASASIAQKSKSSSQDNTIYTTVHENPQYKGGFNELFAFISKEIKYPAEAVQKKINGKVYLKFVVEKDGSVSDVSVLKGIGGGCNEEAKRVILATSGNWTGGKQNGKPVRVYFTIPIKFTF
jgi:TonB family protein